MDFSGNKKRKFIDMISDSTLQVSFKKLPLAKFWLKYLSLFQPYVCMILDSLHILQPKQYTARLNAEADTRIKLFSVQPDTRALQIHIIMPLFAKDMFWETVISLLKVLHQHTTIYLICKTLSYRK